MLSFQRSKFWGAVVTQSSWFTRSELLRAGT